MAPSSTQVRTEAPTRYPRVNDLYVTFDIEETSSSGHRVLEPHARRVSIGGEVKEWQVGDFRRRSGREVHGIRIHYEQTRKGYLREGFTATRGGITYEVPSTDVEPGTSMFTHIVELPVRARNVQLHRGALPRRYREALRVTR